MKNLCKLVTGYADAWDALLTLLVGLIVFLWTLEPGDIIMGILGGIPVKEGNVIAPGIIGIDGIQHLPLCKWLFLFAFFLLIACRGLAKAREFMGFSLCRYPSFKAWWGWNFATVHIVVALVYLASCALWLLLGLAGGRASAEGFPAMLVFYLHLNAMVSVLILGDLLVEKKIVPCILIVIEGLLYVFSVNFRIPALACGMYVRCSYSPQSGMVAIVAYALEIFITVACYAAAPALWRRGRLEQ